MIERVARAQDKYPSISQYYDIEYIRSETNPDNMERVEWTIRDLSALESGHGVYFLRTNIRTFDEKTTWDYYNLIREIECTNYDKFIVMRSYGKCISDYQNVTYLLLISALHNNMLCKASHNTNRQLKTVLCSGPRT